MKKYLLIGSILFMLAPIHSTFAALVLPLDVNDLYIYNKRDSATPATEWTTTIKGLERVDVGGQQFVKAGGSNSHGDGNYEEFVFRSTETAVYGPDGSVVWQVAPIGTAWSFSSSWDGVSGMTISEIISIESVTVPYGTFNNAYVHQVYFDPDDPSLSNTAYWYDYIVPGVGSVKQIDYTWSRNVPIIEELVRIVSVPNPSTIWLLGFGLIGLIGSARLKKA